MSRGPLLLVVVAGLGVLTLTLTLINRQDTDREQVHKQVRSVCFDKGENTLQLS